MIQGINHINLAVRDLEKSFTFYKEIMGFVPLCRWPEGAYFLAGDLWFCLSLDSGGISAKGYNHYSFTISSEEFQAFSEKMKKHEVKFWKENRSEGNSIYVLDPDAHQLEVHVGDWKTRMATMKINPWPNAEFFV